jgi:predicted HTH transcriptional regulator
VINKRLLVKNLLAHNDESSFYDKKRQLNLHSREGKAKFLKHICALSNSNPANNSYIVVGVEDHNNEIVGDDFFEATLRIIAKYNSLMMELTRDELDESALSYFFNTINDQRKIIDSYNK